MAVSAAQTNVLSGPVDDGLRKALMGLLGNDSPFTQSERQAGLRWLGRLADPSTDLDALPKKAPSMTKENFWY